MREVRVLREANALAALASEWDALLAASGVDTVFLTWHWLWSWWEIYGAAAEPAVVTVREDGRLVAAAPLKIERRRRFGLGFRQLDFIGTGQAVCPDFLDLVVVRGREAELAPVLLTAAVHEGGWDRMTLTDIPAASPVRAALTAALRAAGLRPHTEGHCLCPYIPLPASWAELEQTLSHNFRRNHRKKRRRLGATLVTWQPGDDVGVALDMLATLHQERMETSGRGGNFRKADYAAFHRLFATRAARNGWLYIAFLQHEGRAIGGRYGFFYRGVYYAYQSGFDPAMADASPGEVLLGMVIENLISRGAHEFNFLRGAQPHKFHWTDKHRQTLRVEGWARTRVGHALAALDRMAALRRQVRRRIAARRGAPGNGRPAPTDPVATPRASRPAKGATPP